MDPFTIATSVAKITSTCLVTGKTIYDLSCKYQDAPRNMVAISSEVAVISASLSQIQALILSKQDPEMLLRSRPEIAATLDTALTGCMVLFSCLDEEIQNVSRYARGHNAFSWKGKMRVVWKQETFQELLDGIRGQQLAINTLIQLLQMDSLFEITQLLQRNAPDLQKTVERTRSLRLSHPQVKVAESIYSQDDRMSVYSARDSMLASSELDFDFDDIVVNSAAYRRVLSAAKQELSTSKHEVPAGDLIDFSDDATIRQQAACLPDLEGLGLSEDLLGLRFVTEEQPTSQASVVLLGQPETNVTRGVHSSTEKLSQTLREPSVPDARDIPANEHMSPNLGRDESKEEPKYRPYRDGVLTAAKLPNGKLSLGPADDQAFRVAQSQTPLNPTKSNGAGKSLVVERRCSKCEGVLTGQFVRALGGTYHLACFTCRDCGVEVASNFIPIEHEEPSSQRSSNFRPYPLCATDYFRRLDLLCYTCKGPLRGTYVTADDRKYHPEHFSCTDCSMVFGAEDSYYEHSGGFFCDNCYRKYAMRCYGCAFPIVKQFVEIHRNGVDITWHPECYMIHKYWNVHTREAITAIEPSGTEHHDFDTIRQSDESALATISRIWETLSKFEEQAATFISDMLLHASNGAYNDFVVSAAQFLSAVGVLFTAVEAAHDRGPSTSQQSELAAPGNGRSADIARDTSGRQARLLCKLYVSLMQTTAKLSKTHGKAGVTKELLSFVTGLAHRTKMLIKAGLETSLPTPEYFLDDMALANISMDLNYYKSRMSLFVSKSADTCSKCHRAVETYCFRTAVAFPESSELWHVGCVQCPQCQADGAYAEQGPSDQRPTCYSCGADCPTSLYHVTRLKQYRHLLWVALARLMDVMEMDLGYLNRDGIGEGAKSVESLT